MLLCICLLTFFLNGTQAWDTPRFLKAPIGPPCMHLYTLLGACLHVKFAQDSVNNDYVLYVYVFSGWLYVYAHVPMHTWVSVSMYTYLAPEMSPMSRFFLSFAHSPITLYLFVCVCMYVWACVCVYIHIHIYMYIYTHIYTHTHNVSIQVTSHAHDRQLKIVEAPSVLPTGVAYDIHIHACMHK